MSRTMRRTNKGRKIKYSNYLWNKQSDEIFDRWRSIHEQRTKKATRRSFVYSYEWYAAKREESYMEGYYGNDPHSPWFREWFEGGSNPWQWRNYMMTRPARARMKLLLRRVLKGDLDYDDVVFPDYKKPHIYYF